ncbi:MAG TPA: TlpA disulfide reductase family protein [Thiobacillaceae bacterium]|nr:TlpA disulfide reductase family protein [Thiobacillaceae bacterium]HNU63269.1 TlpA disulfide reductase family protein [Thiobacillaceae bacterium]
MAIARALLGVLFLCLAAGAQAGFNLDVGNGDQLEVRTWGTQGKGPLFIWLLNQYGEREQADILAQRLADRGATVWRVDLLDSLLLERTADAIRGVDGKALARLIQHATRGSQRPIVLVACDRMATPALRGLRAWQEAGGDNTQVAGAVLFFPNLYRGTPVAGEAPELLDIVGATNLPVTIMQPDLGTNRTRLNDLLRALRTGGSAAYAWLVPEVRDYYLMQVEKPVSESLQAMAGPVPAPVLRAIQAAPDQLMQVAHLLAATPRARGPSPVRLGEDLPMAPAYGLIKRPARPAPALALTDARGRPHDLAKSRGRVTLVNFWATWCPPCVHEIPSMNLLAAAYDERDFAIVSVNFKEDPEHIRAFMNKVAVDFPVLMDADGSASARWRVFAFPSSFLLDRKGRIRYSVNTAIDWDTDEVRTVIDRLRRE